MKQKAYAKVIFDRKKSSGKSGKGAVEVYIYVNPNCKRYLRITTLSPSDFFKMEREHAFDKDVERCNNIARSMVELGENLITENLDRHLGIFKDKIDCAVEEMNFTDFMYEMISKSKLRDSTKKHEYTTWKSLITFGKMIRFKDITPKALYLYDEWLEQHGAERSTTRKNYHKHLNKYLKKAYERGIITENPYSRCHFKKGAYKERRPLTEEEILRIRNFKFRGPLEKAADLFIFSCYTGLSYCDIQLFDYETMTQERENRVYIDGSRLKTGSLFYTPILPPAMAILKKYNYKLPRMSNQKANAYLKMIQECCGINKNLTFHLGRHSFATLLLSYGTSVENLARMMGHKDIKTTQVYAKILNQTIEQQIDRIADNMK